MIGIDRYIAWPRLYNATSDATGVARLFTRLGFVEVTKPLLDDAATSEAMHRLVTTDLAHLSPDDSLVLFFAGHGHTHTADYDDVSVKTGYVIPVDGGQLGGHRAATWLRLDSWLSDIARLPPRHILVIIDACHSGVALAAAHKWRDNAGCPRSELDALQARRSRCVITSALDDQRAMDGGPYPGHSLFTGCLIEGLSGGLAESGQQAATGREIGQYLHRRVRSYPHTTQTPDFGAFELDDRGDIIVPILPQQAALVETNSTKHSLEFDGARSISTQSTTTTTPFMHNTPPSSPPSRLAGPVSSAATLPDQHFTRTLTRSCRVRLRPIAKEAVMAIIDIGIVLGLAAMRTTTTVKPELRRETMTSAVDSRIVQGVVAPQQSSLAPLPVPASNIVIEVPEHDELKLERLSVIEHILGDKTPVKESNDIANLAGDKWFEAVIVGLARNQKAWQDQINAVTSGPADVLPSPPALPHNVPENARDTSRIASRNNTLPDSQTRAARAATDTATKLVRSFRLCTKTSSVASDVTARLAAAKEKLTGFGAPHPHPTRARRTRRETHRSL